MAETSNLHSHLFPQPSEVSRPGWTDPVIGQTTAMQVLTWSVHTS